MNCFHIFTLVSVKTVTQFVKVTHARQARVIWTPILIEIDSRPFPDYTNTSALIAAIYWCVMVIALHLTTKWPQSLHSSIFSDTPKVTLINQLIHTEPCSVKLCLIHLRLLSVTVSNPSRSRSLSNSLLCLSCLPPSPSVKYPPYHKCSCGVLCLGCVPDFVMPYNFRSIRD